jgi:hypothetical protein
MATKKFSLVSFTKEKGAIFVVPSIWLENDGTCRWPPYATDARVKKAAKNVEAIADAWAKHAVRVLYEAGCYI